MRVAAVFAFVVFCLTAAPVTARADAQQDQNACMMDAQTYCGQFIPDRVQVAHCLQANRHQISPACREAIKHFK